MTKIAAEGSESRTAKETPIWKLWHEELDSLGRALNITDLQVTRLNCYENPG
jgi:hypothetical protein